MSDASKKVPSQAEIEFLAYQIFLERGGEPGHELADWLAAEEQLTTRTQAETPVSTRTDTAPIPMRKSAGA